MQPRTQLLLDAEIHKIASARVSLLSLFKKGVKYGPEATTFLLNLTPDNSFPAKIENKSIEFSFLYDLIHIC